MNTERDGMRDPEFEDSGHQNEALLESRLLGALSNDVECAKHRFTITVFLGEHGTAEDVESLKKYFKECDVFIPEAIGWSDDNLNELRDISGGRRLSSSFKTNFPEYAAALEALLFKSNKYIALIDIPLNHPAIEGLSDWDSEYAEFLKTVFGNFKKQQPMPFRQAHETFLQLCEKDAVLLAQREHRLVSGFPKAMRDLLDTYPALQSKESINVLLAYGGLHTPLAHLLVREGFSVKMKMNTYDRSDPYCYSPLDQVVRAYRFGKRPTESEIAQGLVFNCIIPIITRELKDSARAKDIVMLKADRLKIEAEIANHLRRQDYRELEQLWEAKLADFIARKEPKDGTLRYEINKIIERIMPGIANGATEHI